MKRKPDSYQPIVTERPRRLVTGMTAHWVLTCKWTFRVVFRQSFCSKLLQLENLSASLPTDRNDCANFTASVIDTWVK
ncbi:hypothetical protein [Planctomycetes bacterium CA13]|uniref:hypothetical protein n=1 Tax=Novipirellula herctigrandis TaxID=2527986 RepID=UPI0011B5A20B